MKQDGSCDRYLILQGLCLSCGSFTLSLSFATWAYSVDVQSTGCGPLHVDSTADLVEASNAIDRLASLLPGFSMHVGILEPSIARTSIQIAPPDLDSSGFVYMQRSTMITQGRLEILGYNKVWGSQRTL